jgi:hypothetical protein
VADHIISQTTAITLQVPRMNIKELASKNPNFSKLEDEIIAAKQYGFWCSGRHPENVESLKSRLTARV